MLNMHGCASVYSVLRNALCVTVTLTLKLALRHHKIGYEIVDVKLTPRLARSQALLAYEVPLCKLEKGTPSSTKTQPLVVLSWGFLA